MEDEFTEKGDKNKVPQQEKKLLYERVEELKRSNAFLKAENHMFERFISRLDPGDLVPQPAAEGLGGLGASQLEVGGRGRRQRTQSNTPDCPQQLTLGQKCYVAQRQVEQTQEDLEKHKHSSERIQENYKAILEEADIRLAEIRKAKYEFERDVAEPLKEKKGEIMGAEKVLRYIEDKIKRKDTQVEKLQLKNQALKAQARKLQRQLRQQQQEETLNEADFQQFKIENNQYQEQIDEHNRDLLRLKQLAGDTQQVLNTYKRKLQNVICRSEELSSDITKRKEMLVKIEEETQQVEKRISSPSDNV
ncbi:cilia- and flagella-associated protein 263 [Polymixia lowei]